MKTIQIIHTGGTIAMSEDNVTKTINTVKENPLHSMTSVLSVHAKVRVDDYLNIPSPHITPQLMLELALKIKKYIKDDDIDGIVLTHGTDTLEETAYMLDLVLPNEKPIVVTGAMRSSNELGADGPINLLQSVRVATCDPAIGKGVLVVFNDEIHSAKHVTKTHTSNINTFQSPLYGPLGVVGKQAIHFKHALINHEYYQIHSLTKSVLLLKAVAGMELDWLDNIPLNSLDGLVIEAFGQGNLPPAMVPILDRLIKREIPIVLVSRCLNGVTEPSYEYEGGGKQLEKLGVIFSNGINGQKARLKLMVALETTTDLTELKRIFRQ